MSVPVPPEGIPAALFRHLSAGGQVALFLDYDGTLVPIAATPAEARPDLELLALLQSLVDIPDLQVAIVSGRGLSSLQAMLPVKGLVLAGTYGVEMSVPGRGVILRADAARVRPAVEKAATAWAALIQGRVGFMLEDKGLAIALHARFAGAADAAEVLPRAKTVADGMASSSGLRVLGGDRFLELAPQESDKGETVNWLLDHLMRPRALAVYFGDDDKDERAFQVVRRRGGIAIMVGPRGEVSPPVLRLASPGDVRRWLRLMQRFAASNPRRGPTLADAAD